MSHVDIYPSGAPFHEAVAEAVIEAAGEAITRNGRFFWCLAGGRTPHRAYELLGSPPLAPRIDWERTHVFFGDERCVPPDHPESNYRMAREALLDRVPLARDHIHRIAGEREPMEAARAYEGTLLSMLGGSVHDEPARGFDLLLLGMGADGHTASLFPGSVDEPERWVSARRNPADGGWRVTLTPSVLNATRSVRFIVSGREKAARLADVIGGRARPVDLPVYRIHPRGDLSWIVDQEACAELEEKTARRPWRGVESHA